MLAFLHRILDWFKNVFWKEEMELALVGLQNSGKTTFVNVISVRKAGLPKPVSTRREPDVQFHSLHVGKYI